MKLLIRQGRLVDPVGGIGGIMDVLVEDGKVAVIGSNINEPDARVIDARGLTVCAGLVDMHVHLREPGFEYKEPIETGAAAAGLTWGRALLGNLLPVTLGNLVGGVLLVGVSGWYLYLKQGKTTVIS